MLLEVTLNAALLVFSALRAVPAIPFKLTGRRSGCYVAGRRCRKPCAIRRLVLLPANQGVFGDSGEAAARQSLPGWASSALCFVLRIGPGKQKIAAKSAPKILVQALLRVLRREARMVRGSQNIWTLILPAIATSMIAATGSAVRAAAQPQDQSQAPAGDSPFAILLAALSAQSTPAGGGADTEASSDTAVNSPQNDQTGQPGKPIAAASEKSNADDHVAEAALAALLNTNAAPPPFSPPAPEAATSDTAPATALADTDKAQPANARANPQPEASTPPKTPSVTGTLINPAPPVPGDVSAVPPESGDKVRPDAHVADTSTDSIPFSAPNGPAGPPASGGKAGPQLKTVDASNTDADPASKAPPGKKPDAPDQSQTDAAPALIAAAYAGYAAAGQASANQSADAAVTADTTQSLSVRAMPNIGTNPAKDATATAPDSNDADEPVAADMTLTGSVATMPATKGAAAPVKSTGASAKPVANAQTATDASPSDSQDKAHMLSAAHPNSSSHAAAPKPDQVARSDDNTKIAQADSTASAVPAAAGATIHSAPPPPQPVAVIDPSAVMAPHAASAPTSGANSAASLEITSAAADPVPDLNGFAVSIAARSLSGAKQFEIRLDPPELGRVDVRLSIDAAGKAVAHMATDQPQTLDLLRKDAPALTQALRDAGLDVSQNGLNFSLRGQDRQSGDSQSGAQGRKSNLSARLAIQAVQAPAALAYAGAASNARLDIHV